MSNNDYEILKDFYRKELNIPAELVDILSVNDVLIMCVSGASNESISDTIDMDLNVIKEILETVLNFSGWKNDLPVNPYKIFTSLRINKDFTFQDFLVLTRRADPDRASYSDEDVKKMFEMCSVYTDIENRLDSEWI